MVKKKSTKKEKLTENEKDELKLEGEIPKKSIRKREDRQLLWFFIIVGIVFASFLIPYFWVESEKTFEYIGADWAIEDYDNLRIYHGRFASLAGGNLMFNVFLRGDPRVNDIPTEGTFDKFKYGGVVSMTPEVDACRGELSRVMLDLGSFMRQGIGVDKLESGSTDRDVARETDRRFAQCNTVSDRTLVVVRIGDPMVVQNESHDYCYTIYAENCDDVSSVEKFIIKTIDDFGSVEK